ncbi:hypothetical protein K490DRAFT_65771 [Saccharata proteae CBS 121410]|uniref:Uncharacterized protein n=1 Tax=Saccharata proteae CBS 121410 TaxID=1314787 RepID=A0A9P4HXI7_9PEZI|nr:hypothetical protein K490DRAFT_65771 [Saccharata proteae CBS 121410]
MLPRASSRHFSRSSCLRKVAPEALNNIRVALSNQTGRKSIIAFWSITTTDAPERTSIDQLSQTVKILPISLQHKYRTPLLVLFVTPSVARLLDLTHTKHDLLNSVFNRVFHNTINSAVLREAYALVAVVDRLPEPSEPIYPDHSIDIGSNRIQPVPTSHGGHEGMAVALIEASSLSTEDPITVADPYQQDNLEPSTISLKFRTKHSRREEIVEGDSRVERSRYDILHTVELPLANTIFQNGRHSTMYLCMYMIGSIGGGVQRHNKWELSQVALTLPFSKDTDQEIDEETLFVPLTPLTAPGKIEAAMGNIIRQIADQDGNIVPASKELENKVSAYFSARDEAPHSMPVWALVCPPEVADDVEASLQHELSSFGGDFGALWKRDIFSWNNAVSAAISRGAKLHKVLSGGGGWGKKAGLISLDPGNSVRESAQYQVPGSFDQPGEASYDSPFNQLAQPGHYIQFFASPPFEIPKRSEEIKYTGSIRSLDFGVIPSSVDAMPVSPETSGNPAKITSYPKRFGALSEKGLGIRTVNRYFEGEDPENPTERDVEITHTNIDVPFSRFSRLGLDFHRQNPADSKTQTNQPGQKRSMSTARCLSTLTTLPWTARLPNRPGPGRYYSSRHGSDFVSEYGSVLDLLEDKDKPISFAERREGVHVPAGEESGDVSGKERSSKSKRRKAAKNKNTSAGTSAPTLRFVSADHREIPRKKPGEVLNKVLIHKRLSDTKEELNGRIFRKYETEYRLGERTPKQPSGLVNYSPGRCKEDPVEKPVEKPVIKPVKKPMKKPVEDPDSAALSHRRVVHPSGLIRKKGQKLGESLEEKPKEEPVERPNTRLIHNYQKKAPAEPTLLDPSKPLSAENPFVTLGKSRNKNAMKILSFRPPETSTAETAASTQPQEQKSSSEDPIRTRVIYSRLRNLVKAWRMPAHKVPKLPKKMRAYLGAGGDPVLMAVAYVKLWPGVDPDRPIGRLYRKLLTLGEQFEPLAAQIMDASEKIKVMAREKVIAAAAKRAKDESTPVAFRKVVAPEVKVGERIAPREPSVQRLKRAMRMKRMRGVNSVVKTLESEEGEEPRTDLPTLPAWKHDEDGGIPVDVWEFFDIRVVAVREVVMGLRKVVRRELRARLRLNERRQTRGIARRVRVSGVREKKADNKAKEMAEDMEDLLKGF